MFSLVATLVGGGCLSLPGAFSRVGIGLGCFYLLFSGLLSAFSISLLLSCSRRTGAANYEEVALFSFGKKTKYAVMVLLILLTFLASVAYLVLARDLSSPLVESYIVGKSISLGEKNIVALVVLLFVSPFCYATSLQSLRFTSLLSLIALFFLSCAFIFRSIERSSDRATRAPDEPGWDPTKKVEWVSTSIADTLYAVPFFQLSYMCHFNVLPIHMGLRKPTKRRLDHVVFFTVLAAFTFYLIVSLTGYFYAYDHVCYDRGVVSSSICKDYVPDDILNVFDLRDTLIDTGRVGFLCALMLSYPLLILPCRDTILRLFQEIRSPQESRDDGYSSDGNDSVEYRILEDDTAVINTPGSPEFSTPMIQRNERQVSRDALRRFSCLSPQRLPHNFTTSTVLTLSLLTMIAVPNVSAVWTITGSSVSMLIGFVFPSLFYVKIRSPDGIFSPRRWNARMIAAWSLLVFSSLMGIVCTYTSCKTVFKF